MDDVRDPQLGAGGGHPETGGQGRWLVIPQGVFTAGLWSRPWFRLGAGAALLIGGGFLLCWYFGIWSVHDWMVYQAMSHECHPVWKDLHAGRIHQGQSVEEVIAQTHPVRVDRLDHFVVLDYQEGFSFTGITVVARDGRLVDAEAWSCTWQRTFFQTWSSAERDAFWQAHRAHQQPRQQPP
jgi:hypothetical protein